MSAEETDAVEPNESAVTGSSAADSDDGADSGDVAESAVSAGGAGPTEPPDDTEGGVPAEPPDGAPDGSPDGSPDDGSAEPELGKFDLWWDRNRYRIYTGGLIVLMLLLILFDRMFINIRAGYRGVMFRTFAGGTVVERVWGEGLHVIPPWDRLAIYETRIQANDFTFPTLTRDGLRLDLSISVRYRPRIKELGYLHREIGPEYYERVIMPEIKSALRQTVGDRTAFEIYSTEGDVLQQALKEAAFDIERKPIDLDDVLIKEIKLPPIVKEAIDHKHKQEQALLEYEFLLQSAEKEAERQRTIATGVRDYNAIIATQRIPDDILRWRGIEATVELAKSSNSKMIVIGSGEDGLPIILDAVGERGAESATTGTGTGADATAGDGASGADGNAGGTPPTAGGAGAPANPER